MKIPFIDIHSHGPSHYDDVIMVRSMGKSDFFSGNQNPGLKVAGIHPWWTEDTSADVIEKMLDHIQKLAETDQIWGIGETGLDRSSPDTFDLQKKILNWHIALAEEKKLPLVIHSVRTGSDFLEIIKAAKPQTPWIFHDFRGSLTLVQDLIRLHPKVYFSFGLSVDNSQQVRDLLPQLPGERLFLETDAQKHLDIKEIYLRAAHFLNMDLKDLKERIWHNYLSLKNSHLH